MKRIALLVFFFLCPGVVLAQYKPASEEVRAGAAVPMGGAALALGPTAACVMNSAGTLPELFPWDTLVVLSTLPTAASRAWVCVVQAVAGDLAIDTTTGLITDSGPSAPDGVGACFAIEPGTPGRSIVIGSDSFRRLVGRRTGVCQVTATSALTGRPCRQTNDCAAGQSCLTSAGFKSSGGAFICGVAEESVSLAWSSEG